MRVFDVGIVGGGPGGLFTAYALQNLTDRPIRITLFEASPRLGGKILTPKFERAPVRYEAGAAEFYDYSVTDEDPLRELIAELGLPTRPMGGQAVIMNNRILSNLDDVRDHLGPQAHHALVEFDRFAKDRMTPQDFYHSDYGEAASAPSAPGEFGDVLSAVREPEARRYIETLIHSDLATEANQTNSTYGLQNYVMNDPRYMQLYEIAGGNERLPRELAARVDATKLLGQQVESIARQDDERIRVTSSKDGATRQDDFDYVVLALPHNHLKSIEYPGAALAEAMRAHCEYYDHPAHYLRMTILFEKPFWLEILRDSYWMLDRFGGCCLYDESSRSPGISHGVLGWLLGGDAALEMSERPDDELIEAALDSLPDLLAHGRQYFMEGVVHRWVGAVSAMPGGVAQRSLDQRHQPAPVDQPNLFVVGDYLFDSTLNGLLDSSDYVAAWLANLMIEKDA